MVIVPKKVVINNLNNFFKIQGFKNHQSTSLFENQNNDDPHLISRELDRKFDFRLFKIESKLLKKYRAFYKNEDDSNRKKHYPSCQAWIGLHHYTLQTPYCFIYEAFRYLKKIDFNFNLVVDIGAGYGRVGLVVSQINQNIQFMGYEVVKERVREGNRIFQKYGLRNCNLINENVLHHDFKLPLADVFFIYDFGEKEDIFVLLKNISNYTYQKNILLIANGEFVNDLLGGMSSLWVLEHVVNRGSEMKIYRSKNIGR